MTANDTYNIDELRQPKSKLDVEYIGIVLDRAYKLVVAALA